LVAERSVNFLNIMKSCKRHLPTWKLQLWCRTTPSLLRDSVNTHTQSPSNRLHLRI